jgi:hypothetical protein
VHLRRSEWVARSLAYLQATTYVSRDITISQLTQYLQATVPVSGSIAEYTIEEVRQAVNTLANHRVNDDDVVVSAFA